MKKQLTVLMVIGLFIILCPMLNAKKQVARIVGGENGCTVERMENGALEKIDAEYQMALFPGDILRKPGRIDSVQMEFLPYAKADRKNDNSLIIVFKPPETRESVFTKLKKLFGLVEVGFYETSGASKGLMDEVCLPGENATVIPGQKIIFSNCRSGKTIVFKAFQGKEIFRNTIEEKKQVSLTPADIGMVPAGIYTWEIVDGKEVLYRSQIKQLSKTDGDLIRKDLRKIDAETMNTNQKRVKKAAYLQFMSDLYPGSIDLYWLSYQLLKEVDTKNEKIRDSADTLQDRCLDHFNRGISELDFLLLDSAKCLVTIEWEKNNEKKYVSPNFSFHEGEVIWIHFQTNFDGYAVILYQDKDGPVPVFPTQKEGAKIEAKTDRYSHQCQFDENAGNETFMFILSKKPIREMKDLHQKAQKEGKEINVEFIGTKAFVTTSQKQLENFAWFRLALKNLGKE